MRFIVGHTTNGVSAPYLIVDGEAVNLSSINSGCGSDLQAIIDRPELLDNIGDAIQSAPRVAIDDITPDLPLERPGKIICLGLNYVDHIKEGGYDIPEYPALFMRGLNSMMPSGAPTIIPACSEQLDYEVELMVIIGKPGRHISEEDSLSHVFGYTVFNDGSIRDYQRKTHQWMPGKNFDATGGLGPFVVTPDELPEGAVGLKIETRVGDEILQSASTSDMLWSVTKTIATISEFASLEAGDMIAMGTPPGVGHARKPPRWLRAGETIEVEVEGIGICSNPVVAEKV